MRGANFCCARGAYTTYLFVVSWCFFLWVFFFFFSLFWVLFWLGRAAFLCVCDFFWHYYSFVCFFRFFLGLFWEWRVVFFYILDVRAVPWYVNSPTHIRLLHVVCPVLYLFCFLLLLVYHETELTRRRFEKNHVPIVPLKTVDGTVGDTVGDTGGCARRIGATIRGCQSRRAYLLFNVATEHLLRSKSFVITVGVFYLWLCSCLFFVPVCTTLQYVAHLGLTWYHGMVRGAWGFQLKPCSCSFIPELVLQWYFGVYAREGLFLVEGEEEE